MNITLAAGGTGGHMIPAHALAEQLRARGHGVMLVSDSRGVRFPGLFDAVPTHVLPEGRMTGGLLGRLRALKGMWAGRTEARRLLRDFRPDVVVGFGGYPAWPTLSAAAALRIPTVIHEQNAVLGRVNRLAAGKARAIATAYDRVDRIRPALADKVVMVGNPVRAEIVRLGEAPYPPFDEEAPLKLLITGGSQGAAVLSTTVPAGLALLPERLRHRLQVVQQCRPEDIDRVRERYASFAIPAVLATYIDDMAARIADCHLFIGRSGASTIAELTAAGRPAILVPLPTAMDDHQTANAREMARAGGARMIAQADFTPRALADQIEVIAGDAGALANAAARALSVGRPHAARDLADLVEQVGQGGGPLLVGKVETRRRAAPRGGQLAGAAR